MSRPINFSPFGRSIRTPRQLGRTLWVLIAVIAAFWSFVVTYEWGLNPWALSTRGQRTLEFASLGLGVALHFAAVVVAVLWPVSLSMRPKAKVERHLLELILGECEARDVKRFEIVVEADHAQGSICMPPGGDVVMRPPTHLCRRLMRYIGARHGDGRRVSTEGAEGRLSMQVDSRVL